MPVLGGDGRGVHHRRRAPHGRGRGHVHQRRYPLADRLLRRHPRDLRHRLSHHAAVRQHEHAVPRRGAGVGCGAGGAVQHVRGGLPQTARAVPPVHRHRVAHQQGAGAAEEASQAGLGAQDGQLLISSAGILAKNPQGTMVTVSYASFSAILNMACLVAIGYAFGFENVAALVAAFAVAAISVILSPTPQGVGVVEAAIAAILTAHGCSLATATAIALVYRGIMFWIPFCIGALLLSQSGFFADKKSPTEEK
ncbi:MAG: lysylphosphatidylglycerol synthase transmembrane domain-containing protein, partial [Eggerthella lenta]